MEFRPEAAQYAARMGAACSPMISMILAQLFRRNGGDDRECTRTGMVA